MLWISMKRTWKVVVALLLAVTAISAFFLLAFLLPIPLGDPIIEVEFGQSPPWHVRPGGNVQVELSIVNDAWLLAAAIDVKATVTTSEGLTVSGTNTNEYQISIGTLRGGERLSHAFSVMANISSLPGTYSLAIKISGQNVPMKTLTPKVVVELPHVH